MGVVSKSLIGAFAAVNIVAAAGSFESANRAHENPDNSFEDIFQSVIYRPWDNHDRSVYGEHSSTDRMATEYGRGELDQAIDAKVVRAIGNSLNEGTYRGGAIGREMLMTIPATILAPATWAGGAAGAAVGELGLHFD